MGKLTESENKELQEICGQRDGNRTKTVVNIVRYGNPAKRGQFPWAVSIASWDGYNLCSGTIVSSRHVITAAHCFYTFSKGEQWCSTKQFISDLYDLMVNFGGVCLRAEGDCSRSDQRAVGIRAVAISKEFAKKCKSGSDIAIIELEDDLIFRKDTFPICLPEADRNSTAAHDLMSYGFGRGENVSEPVSSLSWMRFNFSIIRDDYLEMHPAFHPTWNKYSSLCHGDSGSGVQGSFDDERTFLIGVNSAGNRNCTLGIPTKACEIRKFTPSICYVTGICP